jgi:hypothetical protein
MDAVQGLRRRAQSAGRVTTTPQEIVGPEQAATRIEEPITIESSSPEIVYVPICDPSFAYGPWPYPDYPPFFPLFAGASINGCDWISGPIVAPFWGFAVLNFRARHIEIDRKRLALFDRDLEKDREHPLGEEWRHDPGHRGNVPYRDAAVRALLQGGTPAANFNPAFHGRWTSPSPVGDPARPLAQTRQRPGMERAPLDGGRPSREGVSAPPDRDRLSTARVQPRFGGGQPALEGVDPTWDRAPVGQSLNPDALAAPLPQKWQRPGIESARPSFDGGRPWADGVSPPDRNRLSISHVQPRFGAGRQTLEGVDPTWDRAPLGQSLNPDAERRILIEQRSFGRVPSTAVAPPLGGLRASPSFDGMGATRSVGDRRFLRPLIGAGVQPYGFRGPNAVGVQPLNGQGPQIPPGGVGAGGGKGGH